MLSTPLARSKFVQVQPSKLRGRIIKAHIDRNPDLKEQHPLLETIPGIGTRTAQMLLAEIEFERYESGTASLRLRRYHSKKESGSSLNCTNLSKTGNSRIRKGLYFPAIVAAAQNKIVKEFAARLQKNGKTPMHIICATIRKLLHIAFGVLLFDKLR